MEARLMFCDNDDCPRPKEPVGSGHSFSGYGFRVEYHPECCPGEVDGSACDGDHPEGWDPGDDRVREECARAREGRVRYEESLRRQQDEANSRAQERGRARQAERAREEAGKWPALSDADLDRLVRDVAAIEPRSVTFGHGSYGAECPVCQGSTYASRKVAHKPDCVVVRSAAILGSEESNGRPAE